MKTIKSALKRLRARIIRAHLKGQIEQNRVKINRIDRERTLKLQHINELTRDNERVRARLQALNSGL